MDIPIIRMVDRRRAWALRVVLVVACLAIFALGWSLNIWAMIYPPGGLVGAGIGLAISWLVTRTLLALYGYVIQRTLFRMGLRAMKHIQAGRFEEALADLEQHLALLEQHPVLDRWRTVLFLDASRYDYKELTLLNMAYVHIQIGEIDQVSRRYEQCLDINPGNEMVISSLNLINSVGGGEIRPLHGEVPIMYMVDQRGARRIRLINLVITLAVVFTPCLSTLWLLLGVQLQFVDMVLAALGILVAVHLLIDIYRMVAVRLALPDYFRGRGHLKAGRYQEAITAFEDTLAALEANSWIDDFRWIVLLSPTSYSYAEWAWLHLTYAYRQLGNGERIVECLERCLARNPKNGYAQSSLNLVNAVLENKKQSASGQSPA